LVLLWPCQPSWAPCMRDLLRSMCPCSPASLLWTPRTLHGNEGLPEGCVPNAPAKYLRVLGRYRFETFLRSACLEWLCQTPGSYAGYLGVSTLHMFKIYIFHDFISNGSGHHNFSHDIIDNFFIRHTSQDLAGYPRILDKLRPL
jgi:hypothetical protein